VSVRVELPDDVADRLAAAAQARGVSVDELAAEAITAHLPAPPSFIGIGHSGRGDLGARHKEIRHELTQTRRAKRE
jgi:hypothetical protein